MADPETHDAIARELELLGIDINSEDGRKEFRATMAWALANRRRCEKFSMHILLVLGGAAIFGAGTLLWEGIKSLLQKGGTG